MVGVHKRKIRWTISLLLVMLYFSGLPAQAQYGGGSGATHDPYLIYTAEQMNAIGANSNDWGKHFKLVADIDLSAYTGTSFNIIGILYGSFRGVFDGNGHTISNFSYISTGGNYIGLFGYISGENARINDLGLINPNVDAGAGNFVGSLVGNLQGGTISNCYAEGGSVLGAGSEYSGGVGGLVGNNGYSSTITSSYSSSTVTGDYSVGGLVGSNDNVLAHCYATGSVSGTTNVGGLVGDNSYNTITNCYATASVSGTADVGGLVGAGEQWGFGEVTFSFWDIQTSGQSTSASGTGKTTAEMQNPNTFMDAGWDFVGKPDGPSDVWAEPAGGGYPILWWQLLSLPELPTFSGGIGEPDDPFLVSTADELNSIGHNPRLMKAHFRLTNDIDLAGIDSYIMGSEAFPFTGVFDGNGHIISNFSYTSTLYRTDGIGLFGYVDDPNAEIRDLGLIAPNISGRYDVGSLVGQLGYGTVSGCYAEGGSVWGRNYVGGLVGENSLRGTITNCYATVSVLGNTRVGGLVGNNWGAISNCYSAGSVMGDDNVGGLVGTNSFYGTIADCYSTSSVVGIEHVGGLVGSGGRAHNSFWDVQTSGQSTSAGGQGRTTAQMQIASTFPGWNGRGNEGVWTIDEGNDYPRLWWENKQGEVIETQQLSNLLTGAGTQDDPYLIYTAEELNVIGLFPFEWDKQFRLISDIDLSHLGTEFNIIGILNPFTGVFDGNGKKITNLDHTIGLFVYVSGAIRDLGLIDANVDAGTGYRVGSLVGDLQGGTISNCYAEGGSVLGGSDVGGLVGALNWGATITNCYASGDVSGDDSVGGLVGHNSYGTITDCYATGSVLGSGAYAYRGVGGLVGENSLRGTISNCYSSGGVTGTTNVGGLVGENRGEVTDSFWDTQTSGQVTSAGGTGKTTAEMQTAGTFLDASWDFTTPVWTIDEGMDYPRLWWDAETGQDIRKEEAKVLALDDFDGKLSLDWTILHADPSHFSLTKKPGYLTITTQKGSFYRSATNFKNLFLIDNPAVGGDDFEVTTCIVDFIPTANYHQAGLVCINDEDNYIKWTYEWNGARRQQVFALIRETQGGVRPHTYVLDIPKAERVWFRLSKHGNRYTYSTSTDGNSFRAHGDLQWGDGVPKSVGLVAKNADYPAPEIDAAFDFFEVRAISAPLEPEPTPPPKGRGCFLADTPVWVNGALVQISNVVSGQMVREPHCDLATDCLEQIETVEEQHEGTFECRDIVLESGNRISVVDAHCFMLDSGQWIAAQDLRSGLRLKTLSGTVGIKSVATRAAPFVGKVYNLKVTGVDRYLVSEDGVIVRDY